MMIYKFYNQNPDACHYLFGTMHTCTDASYTYADKVKEYILKSQLYAGEMDLDEAALHPMTPYFTLSDGKVLSSYFRPKQFEKYRKLVLKAYHIDLGFYESFSPFFISNLLSELSLHKTKDLPLDHYLWNFASESGRRMACLETFYDQLEILQQIPEEYQVKSLKTTLRNISVFRNKVIHINEMYSRGDIAGLYVNSKKSLGAIRKLMLYDRNVKMVSKIIHLTETAPSFIAVGAAHLPGNKGILAQLKLKGYRIKEVE